mgnify:CR=1 FL=1
MLSIVTGVSAPHALRIECCVCFVDESFADNRLPMVSQRLTAESMHSVTFLFFRLSFVLRCRLSCRATRFQLSSKTSPPSTGTRSQKSNVPAESVHPRKDRRECVPFLLVCVFDKSIYQTHFPSTVECATRTCNDYDSNSL